MAGDCYSNLLNVEELVTQVQHCENGAVLVGRDSFQKNCDTVLSSTQIITYNKTARRPPLPSSLEERHPHGVLSPSSQTQIPTRRHRRYLFGSSDVIEAPEDALKSRHVRGISDATRTRKFDPASFTISREAPLSSRLLGRSFQGKRRPKSRTKSQTTPAAAALQSSPYKQTLTLPHPLKRSSSWRRARNSRKVPGNSKQKVSNKNSTKISELQSSSKSSDSSLNDVTDNHIVPPLITRLKNVKTFVLLENPGSPGSRLGPSFIAKVLSSFVQQGGHSDGDGNREGNREGLPLHYVKSGVFESEEKLDVWELEADQCSSSGKCTKDCDFSSYVGNVMDNQWL